jgi:hypothetical protein
MVTNYFCSWNMDDALWAIMEAYFGSAMTNVTQIDPYAPMIAQGLNPISPPGS